jgi:RecB family exonuclease
MPDVAPTPRNLFSFSRLKTFHQCPLRYRYRYLKGLREAFRSIESYLGTVVHDVLQWLYEERDRRSAPPLDVVLDEFARKWRVSWTDDVAVVRLAETSDDAFRIGREMLERFHGDTFQKDRSVTVALEQRFSERLSPQIVFTGFADRVGRTEDGLLFVVDYKTSKSEGDPSDFSEGLQAPLYAACAINHHDEAEALAGYHYLRLGTTRWQKISRVRSRELLGRFLTLGFNHICPEAQVPENLSGGLRHASTRS